MKRLLLLAATVALASPAFAASGDQVLVLSTFRVTDKIEVSLPRVLRANGIVCQTYVADAARDTTGAINVNLAEICGQGVHRSNARLIGPKDDATDIYPAQLMDLRPTTANGLTHQVPRVE